MDVIRAQRLVNTIWEESIAPELEAYIRIPNKSPLFDADWQAHGFMDEAVDLMVSWCRRQADADMNVEVVRLPDRTPVILIEIPGAGERNVLLYGHLDKQPEMNGWRPNLGPWTPVRDGDRLYGRGGADDGYAIFAALTAVVALREQGVAHANLRILIEASEESGSPDLPFYIDALSARIGDPDLVICLDSGCGNYEQLWCTTSLRGLVGGTLRVDVLSEGVHSGDAGGVVPSSFRILRGLIGRLEDEASGRILPREFQAPIPQERMEQAAQAAEVLGEGVYRRFPFARSDAPPDTSIVDLILNRTWRAALEITGADGLPPLADAGNVLRPMLAAKLSLRLPPSCDARAATRALKQLLEATPAHGAAVHFHAEQCADGWAAPALEPWLGKSMERASQAFFSRPAVYMGEGGSIPFMAMLGARFPAAQFLITGVLGPGSNAHGPNEFLHMPTARRLTGCVAQVIADHHRASG